MNSKQIIRISTRVTLLAVLGGVSGFGCGESNPMSPNENAYGTDYSEYGYDQPSDVASDSYTGYYDQWNDFSVTQESDGGTLVTQGPRNVGGNEIGGTQVYRSPDGTTYITDTPPNPGYDY